MPVSCRCPRRPELCYLLVRRFRHSPATVAVGPVAVTTRTRVRRLPWQAHDSGESGIATSRAPVRHMISGPNAPSSAALHAQSSSERPRSLRASGGDALGGRRRQLGADKLGHLLDSEAVRDHERLSRAVARCGGRAVRARAGGRPGAVAQMQKRGECVVSASMPEYTQTRVRVAAAASKTNARVGLIIRCSPRNSQRRRPPRSSSHPRTQPSLLLLRRFLLDGAGSSGSGAGSSASSLSSIAL